MKLTWADIWKIVIAIIGSVGGSGAVIAFVVKFCSNIIAERLSQKYELKMSKEIYDKFSNLNDELREYLSKLDVLE